MPERSEADTPTGGPEAREEVEVEAVSDAEFAALEQAVRAAEQQHAHGSFVADVTLAPGGSLRVHARPALPAAAAAALRPLAAAPPARAAPPLFPLARYDEVVRVLERFAPAARVRAVHPDIVRALRRAAARAAVEAVGCSHALVRALVGDRLWEDLLEFQRDGVVAALRMGSRVLLADDMGMGKTVSALAIAQYHRMSAIVEDQDSDKDALSSATSEAREIPLPVLILCPATLRDAWISAVQKWLPTVASHTVHSVSSSRDAKRLFGAHARARRDLWDRRLEVSFAVCSYDVLSRVAQELSPTTGTGQEMLGQSSESAENETAIPQWNPVPAPPELSIFRLVIADECHTLRNINTERARACLPVILSAEYRILISGTPVMSRPVELFSLLHALLANRPTDPPFVSPAAYEVRYCGDGGRNGKGASNLYELNALLSHVMVRRMKADVKLNLPPKNRLHCVLELTEDRLRFFKRKFAELDDLTGSGNQLLSSGTSEQDRRERIRAIYAMLFSATATAKVPGIVTRLRQLLYPQTHTAPKVAIFGFHRQMLDALGALCEREKIRYIRMDGTIALGLRGQLVNMYQTDSSVRVAILSIKVASAGLTLTAADYVLFAELDWVPANLTQAEDRAHRIGRVGPLTIEYAIAPGTLDDRLWPAVRRKLGVVGRVVDRRASDGSMLDPEFAPVHLPTAGVSVQATCLAASDGTSWGFDGAPSHLPPAFTDQEHSGVVVESNGIALAPEDGNGCLPPPKRAKTT